MRVFLAGGTGFVGGAVLGRLLDAGHDVSVLTRRPGKGRAQDARANVVEGDAGERGPWRDAVAGHDAVVNMSGILKEKGKNTFQRVYVDGTRNLVEAARDAGARRFVQVSANGVDAARVPYQTTKLEGERIVQSSGLAWTVLRPSIICSPDGGAVRQFADLMRLGMMPVFGGGDYEVAPVALEDVARVAEQSLREDAAANRVFHLCGPEAMPFRRFLKEIRQASGRWALLVPAPKWSGFAMAAVLGKASWFPADHDSLVMLFQGNTCKDRAWRDVFKIDPKPLREGLRAPLVTAT